MIKPEIDLELSIKALEVYPIEPAIIKSMLSNLQKVVKQNCNLQNVSGSFRYSEREIDFAYLAGVFHVSGIDGLQKEIERLKGLGKNPHDIIIAYVSNDR